MPVYQYENCSGYITDEYNFFPSASVKTMWVAVKTIETNFKKLHCKSVCWKHQENFMFGHINIVACVNSAVKIHSQLLGNKTLLA